MLDLHGNAKKKERTPEGDKDENVFDIEQGVAISLLVKKKGLKRSVYHADLWGRRTEKYRALLGAKKDTVEWTELNPPPPFYLFIPQDEKLLEEYEQGWKVTDIFPVNVLGVQTHRDNFAIAYEKADVQQRVKDMLDESITDEILQEKYNIRNNKGWHISEARASLRETEFEKRNIITCAYRPFDERWCFFGYEFMDRPRRTLMSHVVWRDNICLLSPRQIGRKFGNMDSLLRVPLMTV